MKPVSINIPSWQNLPPNPLVQLHTLWPSQLPALRQYGSHNAERQKCKEVNPFHATDLFLHPLKTSENQRFSVFSGGIEKERGMKWVKNIRYVKYTLFRF